MEKIPSLTDLRAQRAVQQQLLDTLEDVKTMTAPGAKKDALQNRIAVIAQSIRDFDLVIAARESEQATSFLD
jgi:hypothetical protein